MKTPILFGGFEHQLHLVPVSRQVVAGAAEGHEVGNRGASMVARAPSPDSLAMRINPDGSKSGKVLG